MYITTPINAGESNMFQIWVRQFRYGSGNHGLYYFSGYAYGSGNSLISEEATTIDGGASCSFVTDSNNKVVLKINGGCLYYCHYQFDYIGWQSKVEGDFSYNNTYAGA